MVQTPPAQPTSRGRLLSGPRVTVAPLGRFCAWSSLWDPTDQIIPRETRPIPGTVTKGCLTVHKPTYDTHLPRSLGAWPPKLQETHLRRAGSRIWMSASLLRALTKPRSPGATGHLTHCADQDPLVFKSGLRFYRAWSLYK